MESVLKSCCTKKNVESACCIIYRKPGLIPNLMLFYYIILCATLGKSLDGFIRRKAPNSAGFASPHGIIIIHMQILIAFQEEVDLSRAFFFNNAVEKHPITNYIFFFVSWKLLVTHY